MHAMPARRASEGRGPVAKGFGRWSREAKWGGRRSEHSEHSVDAPIEGLRQAQVEHFGADGLHALPLLEHLEPLIPRTHLGNLQHTTAKLGELPPVAGCLLRHVHPRAESAGEAAVERALDEACEVLALGNHLEPSVERARHAAVDDAASDTL